jgi:hypothetical protein
MHGNILNQRINYFAIKPNKSYSELNQKEALSNVQKIELETRGILDIVFFTDDGEKKYIGNLGSRVDLPPINHKLKNKFYFTSGTDTWDSVSVKPYFNDKPTFYTTNVRHLKEHYNKPFSEVTTSILERNITLTEGFLSVRINRYTKHRGLNIKYFKKNQRSSGFKIDFKNGNITTYESNGIRKHKSGKIRRNSFIFFIDVLRSIIATPHLLIEENRYEIGFREKIDNEFDNKIFLNTLYRTLCSVMDVEDYSDKIGKDVGINLISEMIVKLFVKLKKIKVPNQYENYIVNWYPTQKYLKKNDNKLIAAILDRLNLKTKSFIKLFHDNPNVNIKNLITLSTMFGHTDLKKYIPNIDTRYYIDSPSLSRK